MLQTNTTKNNKRIVQNTLLLYFRMLFLMCISLFTSRIILKALGVEDYGIYNLVGGVVTLFSFLNGAMAVATQRFFSFAIGKNDTKTLNKLFSITITVHFILACIILIIAEIIGYFFVNYKLNIPIDRIYAANWVFQCSIISFFFSVISVPYNALIIAKEKMQAFAYISIAEACLKLIIVYLLYFFSFDKLILYSIFILIISIIIRFAYSIYCSSKFKECKFKFIYDKSLYNELLSFSSWNIIGAIAIVAKEQGINILLNIFCGVTINAARAITSQVNNAINSFVSNFQIALNPQITKAYASNDADYLNQLIFKGSKYSAYLFFLLALPIFIKTHYILHLWLGIIPDYTVIFIQLVLIQTLIEALSNPLITALLSTGRIKFYQITVGGLLILNIPLSYLFLKLEFSPYITIIIGIIIAGIALNFRLYLLAKRINFSVLTFYRKVVFRSICVILCSLPLPLLFQTIEMNKFLHFILTIIVCILNTSLCIYFLGLEKTEKNIIMNKIKSYGR